VVETFENLQKQNPDKLSTYFSLANAYLADKQAAKAIKTYNYIEKQIGVNEQLSIQKKTIYLALNKEDKAIEEIKKLINAYPENTDYIRLLIDLYIANGHEYKVVELYQKIMEIIPDDATAPLIIADYYLRNDRVDEGTEIARKAIANPQLDVQTKLTFLVLNYLNKPIDASNKERVLGMADLMIKTHPESPRAYTFRGDVYSSLDEDELAIKDYKAALEFEKNIYDLWKKIIGYELEKAHYQSVCKLTEESLDYFPMSAELYLMGGIAHMRLKENTKAESLLKQGLELVVDDDWQRLQFYSSLGEVYNSLKDYPNSDTYFEKALEVDNKDPYLLNNYAYYLSLRREKLDKAKEMSLRSLEINPDNPAYLDTYGWILYLNNEFEKAKEYMLKALEKKPWDADILEHLGDVCYKLGQPDEALKYWERAKKKGSVSELLDKKITDKKLYE
jgi:tetratricopeptide (TPR) repeat protein